MSPNLRYCYGLLDKTGRSFSVLIHVLEKNLRDAVCVFYLVFRSVDTIEDDMSIPQSTKVTMLQEFDKYLMDLSWKYSESMDEYATVLENFPSISNSVHELPRKYSDIIVELADQIGKGMATFVGLEIVTMEDLESYSHFAAEIFCSGVFRLFVASGLEKGPFHDLDAVSEFSLFLHKTNIIKDFWKDMNYGRLYWPKEMWSKYVKSPEDLQKSENRDKAVECLNEFVAITLEHLPKSIPLLVELRHPSTRKFFAANKLMALASLERCCNNQDVFTKAVKISREEMARITLSGSSVENFLAIGQHYTLKILRRATEGEQTTVRISDACRKILDVIELQRQELRRLWRKTVVLSSTAVAVVVVSFVYWYMSH